MDGRERVATGRRPANPGSESQASSSDETTRFRPDRFAS